MPASRISVRQVHSNKNYTDEYDERVVTSVGFRVEIPKEFEQDLKKLTRELATERGGRVSASEAITLCVLQVLLERRENE